MVGNNIHEINVRAATGLYTSMHVILSYALFIQRFKPLPSIRAPPLLFGTHSTVPDIVETDLAVDLNYTSSRSPLTHPPTPSLPSTVTPHLPVRYPTLSSKLMLSGKPLLAREHCNSHSLNTNTSNNCCTSISGRHGNIPGEPPVDDPFAVLLCVKIPNGNRVQRRFRPSDLLCHVVAFALQHCKEEEEEREEEREEEEEEEEDWELSTSDVPRKVFNNLSLSLKEAGLESRTLLHLTPL